MNNRSEAHPAARAALNASCLCSLIMNNVFVLVLVTIISFAKVSFALPVLHGNLAQGSNSATPGMQVLTALIQTQKEPEQFAVDVVGGIRSMHCEALKTAEQNQAEHMGLLLAVRTLSPARSPS